MTGPRSTTAPDTAADLLPAAVDEPAVVREALAYYRSESTPTRLLKAFRASSLYVRRTVSPPAVPVVHIPGMGQWLQAFSTVQRVGAAAGIDHWMPLLGAELLDLVLPVLPRGVGVLLDPGTAHMIAFPPVEPIVARSLALAVPEAV